MFSSRTRLNSLIPLHPTIYTHSTHKTGLVITSMLKHTDLSYVTQILCVWGITQSVSVAWRPLGYRRDTSTNSDRCEIWWPRDVHFHRNYNITFIITQISHSTNCPNDLCIHPCATVGFSDPVLSRMVLVSQHSEDSVRMIYVAHFIQLLLTSIYF